MELKLYGRIVRRYLWLVIGLPAAVLTISLVFRLIQGGAPPLYRASIALLIDVPPLPTQPDMGFDPRQSAAEAAEFLVDDFSQFVTKEAFARLVSQHLAGQGIQVSPGAISASESSERRHRVVTLWVTWPDPREAEAIARAAGEVAQMGIDQYFARSGVVTVIQSPVVTRAAPPLRQRLELPLRVLLALLVGLGLAFLLDYLDDSVRTVEEAEALLDVPVLGEIPANPPRRRRWW